MYIMGVIYVCIPIQTHKFILMQIYVHINVQGLLEMLARAMHSSSC